MESFNSDTKMEESSWTFYIEGFVCEDQSSDFSSELESPSLVSDAASSAVKKLASNCNEGTLGFSSAKHDGESTAPLSMCKQNSFKKQKTLKMSEFDLEDTASSPVNSPKVSHMNQFMELRDKSMRVSMDFSKVRGTIAVKNEVHGADYTDLKKGTCGETPLVNLHQSSSVEKEEIPAVKTRMRNLESTSLV